MMALQKAELSINNHRISQTTGGIEIVPSINMSIFKAGTLLVIEDPKKKEADIKLDSRKAEKSKKKFVKK